MKSMRRIFLLVFVLTATLASGQVSDFTLVNAVNGQNVSLSSYSGSKAVVIIFTSNYCPFSKLYEARIKKFHEDFNTKGVQLLLINPNNPQSSADDSVEEMKARAEKNGYSFPYLADKEQKVSSELKALKTPQAFVLVPSAGTFNVVYNGAIDDNPQVETDVSKEYLKEAVEAVLNGSSPSSAKTYPTGCIIKKG